MLCVFGVVCGPEHVGEGCYGLWPTLVTQMCSLSKFLCFLGGKRNWSPLWAQGLCPSLGSSLLLAQSAGTPYRRSCRERDPLCGEGVCAGEELWVPTTHGPSALLGLATSALQTPNKDPVFAQLEPEPPIVFVGETIKNSLTSNSFRHIF